ncbi:MAG TPA: alpha/beta hydrolase fold domain-containing protein, partial [Thermoanaerobaculia bacterium]
FVSVSFFVVFTGAGSQIALAQACETHSGLTYGTYVSGSGQTQELKLELLVPKGATAPTPLVMWIHGGGWWSGSRLPVPSKVSALCARGYAVASVDYRYSTTARWPAQIQDIRGAVRWLRAHAADYNLDPDRFGAWGESAGGHLAATLATSGGVSMFTIGHETVDLEGAIGGNLEFSSRVQAAVDTYGATDFLRMSFYPTPEAPNHNAFNSAESRLVGGPIQDYPERAALANPITYVTPDDPPMLVMHGALDILIPFDQSEQLADALRAQRVPVTFLPLRDAGHGGSPWTATNPVVYTFFDDVLLRSGSQTLRVVALDPQASEGGVFARFQISRADASRDLAVRYVLGGSARNGEDYSSREGFVTLPAGSQSITVPISPVEDDLAEGDETVVLTLANDPSYRIDASGAAATVTIADDDSKSSLPSVSVTAADPKASEGGPDTGSFEVSRKGTLSGDLTVRYTVSGTAGDTDFEALSGSVTLKAGQASALVSVAPVDDGQLEPTQMVILTLEASASYALDLPVTASVRIADDEDPALPTVSAIAADADASESGGKGTFFVTRTGSTTNALTVDLAYKGAAEHGIDYSAPLSVTFPSGVYRVAVEVQPVDDLLDEHTERVVLLIPPAQGMLTGPRAGRILLSDNESPDGGALGDR